LNNVTVHDYVPEDELRSLMAAADCALITLRDDCLGIMSPSKLHANLAMQLPIIFIGPRGCNVAEAIDRFGCGISLRTGDVDSLVAFVMQAIEKPDEFASLGVRARRAFETAYSDAQTLPQFDAVLESVAGTESTPRCDAPETSHVAKLLKSLGFLNRRSGVVERSVVHTIR